MDKISEIFVYLRAFILLITLFCLYCPIVTWKLRYSSVDKVGYLQV